MSVANTYVAAPDGTSDSTFRIWGSGIANAVANCGWVKTVDAAQINWTTVLANTTINTVCGYEVWHMNDTGANANQASNPVFMKLEYGNGATNTNPALWITVGTTCNSSGGLGGAISTRNLISNTKNVNSTILNAYSGDVNRFHIGIACFSINASGNVVAGAATGSLFSVERTKDASGNDTNEGVLILLRSGVGQSFFQQYLNLTAGPTGVEGGGWGALMPTANIQVSTGIQTAVYPIYFSKGVFVNPAMGVLCVDTRLVSEFQTMSVPIYGSNHTYMCFSNAMFSSSSARGGTGATCMLRWE